MQESESLFDVVLDAIVEPLERKPAATCYGCGAEIADAPGVAYCDECVTKQSREHAAELEAFDAYHEFADRTARGELETPDGYSRDNAGGLVLEPVDVDETPASSGGLVREHPPHVREILRRAGLSMAAELEPEEVARAERAVSGVVEMFPDPRTPAAAIREYIIPRASGEFGAEGVTG